MNDRKKSCLSCSLLLAAGLLPLLALGIGRLASGDWQTGLYAMVITFAVLVLAAIVLMLTIRRPSAWIASLPFAAGLVYTLIPNPIPIPIDAVLAVLIGGLVSYLLALRRWPRLPRWVAIPMLLCCLYNIIGGFIPGPLDEIIAYAMILGAGASRAVRGLQENRPAARQVVDVEAQEVPVSPPPMIDASSVTLDSDPAVEDNR
jgi:hypothetical protein